MNDIFTFDYLVDGNPVLCRIFPMDYVDEFEMVFHDFSGKIYFRYDHTYLLVVVTSEYNSISFYSYHSTDIGTLNVGMYKSHKNYEFFLSGEMFDNLKLFFRYHKQRLFYAKQ